MNEHDFKTACESNTVANITIVHSDSGYMMFVSLTYNNNLHTIYNIRSRPRIWTTFDAVLNMLSRCNCNLTTITVKLNKVITDT